jgi:ADP-ribose pyrophosphatase YjhB (NUDIX family)
MEKTSRVVIIDDGKLIAFFRRKIKDGKEITYYAIPGGHVEGNESSEETAIREIKEELNLDIEILGYLGKLVVGNKQDDYYHAKIVGGKLQFGGEELDRNSEENYYEVRMLPLEELDNSDIRALDLVKRAITCEYEN